MSRASLIKQANLANLAGSPHINTALSGFNNAHFLGYKWIVLTQKNKPNIHATYMYTTTT